jgi:hypothetical protein
MASNQSKKIGDCEICDSTNTVIVMAHGNIWMCESCKKTDDELTIRNKEINSLIQSSTLDAGVQIKTDLFNAATVASIELKGAIDADESIPADKKDYFYAKVCLERFQHFQKVVFEQRQELLVRENEMRAWQVQTQTAAGKLRSEYREQFRSVDVSYQPTPVKIVKSNSGKSKGEAKTSDVIEAAKKFNVPASGIKMILLSHKGMSPEAAAKKLAEQMGLLPSVQSN